MMLTVQLRKTHGGKDQWRTWLYPHVSVGAAASTKYQPWAIRSTRLFEQRR